MTTDTSIFGLIDALGGKLDARKVERPQLAEGPRVPMTRRRPIFVEPASEIAAEAREIVATIFEDEGTAIARRCAVMAREGAYDGDSEMLIAEAALRRGVVIGRSGK